jgi:hypothetical protein
MMAAGLPDAGTLATLVSNVTQTMCGISFSAVTGERPTGELCWRVATLPIRGERPLTVVLSSSQHGCTALGAALFSCEPDTLDESMIEDSLRELLNMAAGQIKGALALDQALGLPEITTGAQGYTRCERALREGVVLRSQDDLGLLIFVSEEKA